MASYGFSLLDVWCGLTRQYQCTLAQLVIAWAAEQPGVTQVLRGARHVEQATDYENITASIHAFRTRPIHDVVRHLRPAPRLVQR
jgi:aryl-alcohol dehydrogenase-like predicted oxidoreductase